MRQLSKNPSFANFWYLTFDFELATECPRINSSIYGTLKDAAQLPGRIFPINLWLSSSSFCANNDKDTSKRNIFQNWVRLFFLIRTNIFHQSFLNSYPIHGDLKVLPESLSCIKPKVQQYNSSFAFWSFYCKNMTSYRFRGFFLRNSI